MLKSMEIFSRVPYYKKNKEDKNDGFVKSNISPPLAGGDKGEGDNEPAEIPLLFTLTPALSRRGRGSVFDFLRFHQF
jgi:hypothetical protein